MRPIRTSLLVSQRKRRAARGGSAAWQRGRRAGLGCGAGLAVLLVGIILAGAAGYAALTANLPDPRRLIALLDAREGLLLQPTRLYDRTGQHLLTTLESPGAPRRYLWLDPAQPEHVAPLLAQVVVAVEDPSFWSHPGVTPESLLAAAPQTIAERLADRLLLEDEPPGWRRAQRARLLALQITARYGRAQVLEWYLNSAPFGRLAYGADSAARLYLNKSARDLNLAEAAMLAAALQAPALNPIDAPAAALERQKSVLDRLIEQRVISAADYLAARATTLRLRPALEAAAPEPARAFTRLALDELAARFGRERLERGGLRIITSLDYEAQEEMRCVLRAGLARFENQPVDPNRRDGAFCQASRLLPALAPGRAAQPDTLQGSAVLLDLQNGQVLAYVGDLTLAQEAEIARSPKSPGSLLSPFVALAGFARGLGPASLVWDIPASLPETLQAQANPDGVFHGPQRLRVALANDYLAPIAQLLAQVGPESAWRLAEPLGLRGLEREARPLELLYRGGNVAMLDVAQAYGTLARLGDQIGVRAANEDRLRPALTLSVQALDGQVLLAGPGVETRPVLSAPLAYLLHDILSDETARQASLGYPNALEIGRPAGARLGQSEGGRQVWAVGYTPQRLALAWLGLPDEAAGRLDVRDAAGIWHALIQSASQELPAAGWTEPAGLSHVTVCNPSGLLPTAACPNSVSELFLSGSEPVETDTLYRVAQVNRQTGRLATVFTPPALVETRTVFSPPPEAVEWARAAGLPLAPSDYDLILAPAELPDARISAPALFGAVRGAISVQGSAAGAGFQGYRLLVGEGLNPQSWLQIGREQSAPVENGALGEWDTSGLDGLYALRLQVFRADNRVDTATIQVAVDNQPPQVRLYYPSEGQVIAAEDGPTITFQARIEENLEIERVEWRVDGLVVGQSVQAPYSYPWRAVAGNHRVQVRAVDRAGNAAESAVVEFEVR